MLHRVKLLQELELVSDQLFLDLSDQVNTARTIWDRMVNDAELPFKIAACQMPWPLPLWQGQLDLVVNVKPHDKPYQLLSVDGSQVYPDKHQGTSCFLINIGTVELQYATGKKGIVFQSIPRVFTDLSQELGAEISSSADLVNAKREELELQAGLEYAVRLKTESDFPLLFLFDGSLIFWHLASKEQQLKQYFLNKYMKILQACADNKLLIAGYISLPKSKDLIALVRTVLCNFNAASKEHEAIEHLTDTSITRFFLGIGQRTTVFKSQSPITQSYPPDLAPYFFYYHIGAETVRVEVPCYIAKDEEALSLICSIILDQVNKGAGFPVSLAEAHEQAVVKGPDREFFYHLIEKLGIAQNKSITLSQKSRKKRGIAI
ncbi:MAG: DNA double-strand break repair nuclease NurA [Proteobacteria bacterium]|nr:DNA double-strand break repair nuclease NurA [Pseudomonadota bacterium]